MSRGSKQGWLAPLDDEQEQAQEAAIDRLRAEQRRSARTAIAQAICDPGALAGMKGERSLTEWQTDAVLGALKRLGVV